MTSIPEMTMNMDFAIKFISLILVINILIITFYFKFFKKYLSYYFEVRKEFKQYFFWFYYLCIVAITLFFTNNYAGIFDGFKNLIVFFSLLFIFILNTIFYCRYTRLTTTQYKKALTYLFVIWFISYATIYVIEDAYKPYDEDRNWDSFTIEYKDHSILYNISAQVNTKVIAFKGFFINTPLLVCIYEGVIRYNGENISTNDTIVINVSLSPHQYYSENGTGIDHLTNLKTEFNSENKYIVGDNDLPDPWLISYPYNGEKYLNAYIYVNGDLKGSFKKHLVFIEKGHVKSQVEMSRAVIIFAMWTIFAALYRPIDKVIDWWFQTRSERFVDDENQGLYEEKETVTKRKKVRRKVTSKKKKNN